MANVVNLQVLENGPKWYIVKGVGILDTSDFAIADLIDTTAAAFNAGFNTPGQTPYTVRVKEIEYAIEDGLAINLFWDATADVLMASLTGRGELCFDPAMENNAGAGKTGKVQYSSSGWSASGVMSYNFVFKSIKAFS